MCAWYGWQRVGSEMETAFYSSFTEHTHTLYVRHVRGEKYGILQVCVRSGAKQRGGYRLRLIFVWSVSWAVFGFWIFKVHFFFFLADIPVGFSSVDVCHFGFCRMWTFTVGVGQLNKNTEDRPGS